jgi:hypothetical protein
MLQFRVRFLKCVPDATGHDHRICQRSVDVKAVDEQTARREAKRLFCSLERIGHWSFRADAAEVELLQMGKRRAA